MSERKAFSLVELSIVLVIVGILLSMGGIALRRFLDFLSFKEFVRSAEEKKDEFTLHLPVTSVDELERFSRSLKPQETLVLSELLERFYPDPCQYSPRLLPSFMSPLLEARDPFKRKGNVILAIAAAFKDKPLRVSLGDSLLEATALFPASVYEVKGKACPKVRGAEAAIALLKLSGHVLKGSSVEVTSVVPPSYELKVISPQRVEVRTGTFSEFSVPLKPGLNLLTFILVKDGREVYRRTEYVASFRGGQRGSLVKKVTVKGDVVVIEFKGSGKALIEFGDGKVLFLPKVTDNFVVKHSYPPGSFKLKVYTETADGGAVFERKVKAGNPSRNPKVSLKIREDGNLWLVKLRIEGGKGLSCLAFENTVFLTESENCTGLTLRYGKGTERLLSILVKEKAAPLLVCNVLEEGGEMTNLGCTNLSAP